MLKQPMQFLSVLHLLVLILAPIGGLKICSKKVTKKFVKVKRPTNKANQ